VTRTLAAIDAAARLEALARRLFAATGWDDLLGRACAAPVGMLSKERRPLPPPARKYVRRTVYSVRMHTSGQ